MTNAAIYHVASGQSFFSGVALVVLAVLATRIPASGWSATARTVAACAGLTLIAGSGSLVLAEIGGNDILGDTGPEAFGRGLDALLGRLRAGGRTVVMLELPLPPSYNRYGEAQRRLARRHGAFLVPKRVLLGVMT